jgi:hypothetical protein
MPYKSTLLKDVYSYLLEKDQSGLTLAHWVSLSPLEFKQELTRLKRVNANLYGSMLVDLYINTQTRQKLLDNFNI